MEENMENATEPVVVAKKKNGLGIAGLIISIVAAVFSWVPIFKWIVWAVGFILSFIAVFKAPRKAAIAGLIISCIALIIIIVLLCMAGAAIGAAAEAGAFDALEF